LPTPKTYGQFVRLATSYISRIYIIGIKDDNVNIKCLEILPCNIYVNEY
jgi:hypothetical protein